MSALYGALPLRALLLRDITGVLARALLLDDESAHVRAVVTHYNI